MKKLHHAALAVSALSCASVIAQAQTQTDTAFNPSWYVTPSVNVLRPDSRFGTDDNGGGIGLRFGKAFSPSWDLQFGPTFARSNGNGLRYEQTTLGADWLYMFSRDRFRPFLLLGLGAERDKVSGGGADASRTSPYVNGGLGFQYSLSDQWSTQVDLRRVHGYLRNNTFNFDRSNNNYLTVGLTYTFDKPRQQVVAAPEPVAAPAPLPEPVAPVAPKPRFERVTLSATELFAFNSAELGASQPRLDAIATALSTDKTIDNLTITGYSDRIGAKAYNIKLSLRRAQAVKAYLVDKGVDATRLTAEGKGPANPVVECKQTKRAALIECLEPNRRVEVEQITIERRVN